MNTLIKDSSDNTFDGNSQENSNQTTLQICPIPVHHYPIVIRVFWGFVSMAFVINLLVSCIWNIPHHIQALHKMEMIKELVKNNAYFDALQVHESLCDAYPQRYVDQYAEDIASVCFECSRQNQSFFKKGIHYLEGKQLSKGSFSRLYRKVPAQLKKTYTNLFDVLCREKKDHNKEYAFVLNNEKVKEL